MTEAQHTHIMALWGDARRVLRARGLSPKEADAQRKIIHAQAGAVYRAPHPKAGQPKSSWDLTNDDVDEVKAKFLAISRPDDLQAQLDQENQPAKRFAYSADAQAYLDIIGVPQHERMGYVDQVCKNATRNALIDLPSNEHWKVMAALKRTAKYKSPDKQWAPHNVGAGFVPPPPDLVKSPAKGKPLLVDQSEAVDDDTGDALISDDEARRALAEMADGPHPF